MLCLSRYDYDNVDIDTACEMMEDLEMMIIDKSFVKQRFAVEDKIYKVEKADNFEYTDPVDSTISRNQVHDTLSSTKATLLCKLDVTSAQWALGAGVTDIQNISNIPCWAVLPAGSADNLL